MIITGPNRDCLQWNFSTEECEWQLCLIVADSFWHLINMDEDTSGTIYEIKAVYKCVERATSAQRVRQICHGCMFVDFGFWIEEVEEVCVCVCVMDSGAAVCVSDLH